ncbi:hypothetical protein [Psychromonas sp.]|uniref:hypothetical protein n=1 Tax=Psychromonas sp. TaxID=1884585 RepID=UPI00356836D7
MTQYSRLSALERKIILFNYEKNGAQNITLPFTELSDEDRSFITTEGSFILWELEKRKLQGHEVVAHSWIILAKDNMSLLLHFQENNILQIGELFDHQYVDGVWFLDNGILVLEFVYQQHHYDINIIANNNRLIHSALQIIDNESIEFLKVIPLSHAKYGKSLKD